MSGVHGVGEYAQGLVAEALRVVQGLSHNRLLMEARHAVEDQQLLGPAAQTPAQRYLHPLHLHLLLLNLIDRKSIHTFFISFTNLLLFSIS